MKILVTFALMIALASEANAESFCKKESLTATEQLICNTPELVWDDRSLNALFHLARVMVPASKSKIDIEQKHWLIEIRNRCDSRECLLSAYKSRNKVLNRYVNSIADTFPATSAWSQSFSPYPNPEHCSDTFDVNIVRPGNDGMIGVWEASTFCGSFVNGGMLDIREDGKLLDVRVLGGRGPSYKVGVALLARKGNRLYVANLFERSSIGMQGDYEFFTDGTLNMATKNESSANDYDSPTFANLESAWKDTETSALNAKICSTNESMAVCIRRVRP